MAVVIRVVHELRIAIDSKWEASLQVRVHLFFIFKKEAASCAAT